jgi:hypothetical protein
MEMAKIRWFSYGAAILAVARAREDGRSERQPSGLYVSPDGNGQAH